MADLPKGLIDAIKSVHKAQGNLGLEMVNWAIEHEKDPKMLKFWLEVKAKIIKDYHLEDSD